jgi:hypothetical protein
LTTSQLVASIAISCTIAGMSWALYGMVRASSHSIGINIGMGIRLPSLMKNESSWKRGHAAAVPVFYWSAIATSVFSIGAIACSGVEALYVAFVLVCATSLTLGSSLGILVAHRAARAASDES